MPDPGGTRPEAPRGLHDHLVDVALKARLDDIGDPRLAELAEVDAEDAHTAIAQYLERLLAESLSTLRGRELRRQQFTALVARCHCGGAEHRGEEHRRVFRQHRPEFAITQRGGPTAPAFARSSKIH